MADTSYVVYSRTERGSKNESIVPDKTGLYHKSGRRQHADALYQEAFKQPGGRSRYIHYIFAGL
jgi:hypothetical protein